MSYQNTLRTVPFLRMLAGHGMATLAQLQLTMAVGIYALNATGSGIWVSAAVSLSFAPYVVFSTSAGMLADRHSRSTILRWSILLRVVTALLVTAGLVLRWPVPMVIALAALTATFATPSYPALAAATPQLVRDNDLPAANSLATGIENAGWVAGPGLLGLLLLVGAPVAGGGVAAVVCFVAAAVCLGRLDLPATVPEADSVDSGPAILGAFRVVAHNRRIRRILLLAVLNNALYGYLVVALVLVGERVLRAGESGIGWLNASFAVGAFTSMAIAARLAAGRQYRKLIVFNALFVGCGLALAAAQSLPFAVVVVFFAGLSTVVAEIIAVTLIQRLTANTIAARVFGLYDTLAILAIAVCTGLAGWLSEALGIRTALFVVCSVIAVITAWIALVGRSRTTAVMAASPPATQAWTALRPAVMSVVPPMPASTFTSRPGIGPGVGRVGAQGAVSWLVRPAGPPHTRRGVHVTLISGFVVSPGRGRR
jgi:MFS family permease